MDKHIATLEEIEKECREAARISAKAHMEGTAYDFLNIADKVAAAIALMRGQSEKPAFSFAVKTIGVPHNEGMQFIGVVYRPFECAELPSEGCRYAAHEIEQEPAE